MKEEWRIVVLKENDEDEGGMKDSCIEGEWWRWRGMKDSCIEGEGWRWRGMKDSCIEGEGEDEGGMKDSCIEGVGWRGMNEYNGIE